MLLVALTGGIATGKTHVRLRVASRGIPTIDADAVVHDLMGPGGALVAAVAARFGAEMVQPDGGIDRRSLGRVVFADPAARSDLEALVHPLVYARIRQWAEAQSNAGAAWALADIPLLYETRREREFDAVIVTACQPDAQRVRLQQRDGVTEAEANARLAAQWPVEEKARRADYLVRTDGTFRQTDARVDEVIAAIEERLGARNERQT